jgi:hypothetical protein
MKSLSFNSKKIEVLAYFLIWTLVFSVPYFSERSSGHINWNEVTGNWIHLIGYLAIFLINVYILVPRFLLNKRYLYYAVFVSVSILLVVIINMISPSLMPPPGASEMNLPHESFRPPNQASPNQKPPFMAFVDNLIICILIAGAGTTIKLMSKWLSEEELRKDVEKEQLKTSLALLRNQVSPHFFMNTLNNIHTLVEIDTDKAQDAIVRLSTLMRYLLYDSAQSQVELKKEIEFINSYITLMQLRHSDEVEITVNIPGQIPDTMIPPMLFISFLENAFKHGVNYPLKSTIIFELQIDDNALFCRIRNSKHTRPANNDSEYSGIGLDNIKKSLKLLYEDDYKLVILDNDDSFEVNLTIPI